MTESPFISYLETGQRLQRSLTTVKRMVKEGIFHAVPNPVRPMLLRAEVEAYIARTTNGHAPGEVPAKPPGVEKRGRGRPRKDKAKAKRRIA